MLLLWKYTSSAKNDMAHKNQVLFRILKFYNFFIRSLCGLTIFIILFVTSPIHGHVILLIWRSTYHIFKFQRYSVKKYWEKQKSTLIIRRFRIRTPFKLNYFLFKKGYQSKYHTWDLDIKKFLFCKLQIIMVW